MANEATPKQKIVYRAQSSKEPFNDWLNNLRDVMGRKRILARVARLDQGNYGDCESVGDGVRELRLFFGGGYRVYFGEKDGDIVVLLCGGDKDSQEKDIELAKIYWEDYLSHDELPNDSGS